MHVPNIQRKTLLSGSRTLHRDHVYGWMYIGSVVTRLDVSRQSYGTNFLPFFFVSRPLISSDQMIIGCLLMSLIFYFIFPWCVIGTPPPPSARFVTLSSMSSQRTFFVLCYPSSHEAIITFLFLIVNNGLLTLYFFCWVFWPTLQRVVQLRGNLQ